MLFHQVKKNHINLLGAAWVKILSCVLMAFGVIGLICFPKGQLQFVCDVGAAGFGCLSLAFACNDLYKKINNSKIEKLISNIGCKTLGIYAIHWCLLFSTGWGNFSQGLRTVIGNEYIIGIIIAAIWTAVSLFAFEVLSKSKILCCLFLGKNLNFKKC